MANSALTGPAQKALQAAHFHARPSKFRMSNDLQENWKLIETFLRNARSDLPMQASPSLEFSALLTEFDKYLSHNELGLALESIAAAGQLVETGGRFWHSLHQAARKWNFTSRHKSSSFDLFRLQL
ncbi:MAG: hypothetical protein IPG34_20175 [Rhodocyclaceae bacterium]|nr:hypothetical protein [Rhodocyclaceae bacterium]